MNLEKEIKINKILLILLITLSVGTIALRTSHAMFSKKETFNNVLRIITGSELPSKGGAEDLIKKAGQGGLQGIDPETGTLCSGDCKEYRYTGTTVKNYVKLNNNGEDELWRIIGVFTDEDNGEKYMRIVREKVLPENYLPENFVLNGVTYSIKTFSTHAYWNTGGSSNNDWSKAGLQYYLNNEKDSSGTKGYIGYLSDNTKNMLRETKHYLGTVSLQSNTSDKTIDAYKHERDVKKCVNNTGKSEFEDGCRVWKGNQATWSGKISLMYPSDIGFTADSSYWNSGMLYYYSGILATSWMYNSASSWLISPLENSSWVGGFFGNSVQNTPLTSLDIDVRPVLNIKSNVKIKDGTEGTESNPYILELS